MQLTNCVVHGGVGDRRLELVGSDIVLVTSIRILQSLHISTLLLSLALPHSQQLRNTSRDGDGGEEQSSAVEIVCHYGDSGERRDETREEAGAADCFREDTWSEVVHDVQTE